MCLMSKITIFIQIPYIGIFLRRQIFAVLFQKHGDYFFADFNFRGRQHPRKIISIFFAKSVEWVAQFDFPSRKLDDAKISRFTVSGLHLCKIAPLHGWS